MGKVVSYDFSRYQETMVSRFGHTEDESNASWSDLKIILNAMEKNPEKTYALTAGADNALHPLLLDTAGLVRFSGQVFGAGTLMMHDPFCYGTPEFEAAWQNTREAFAAHGIELPVDYRVNEASSRDAETCVLNVNRVAETCVINVSRVAETCVLSVSRIAETCVLSVGKIGDIQAA